MHCNTFKQGVEPVDEPLAWLMNSHDKYNVKVGLRNIGSTFKLS
jgi:hypothetical protein